MNRRDDRQLGDDGSASKADGGLDDGDMASSTQDVNSRDRDISHTPSQDIENIISKRLKRKNDEHAREIREMKSRLKRKEDAYEAAMRRIDEISVAHEAEVERLSSYAQCIKHYTDGIIRSLKQKHADRVREMREMKSAHDAALKKKVDDMNTAHAIELERVRSEASQKRASLVECVRMNVDRILESKGQENTEEPQVTGPICEDNGPASDRRKRLKTRRIDPRGKNVLDSADQTTSSKDAIETKRRTGFLDILAETAQGQIDPHEKKSFINTDQVKTPAVAVVANIPTDTAKAESGSRKRALAEISKDPSPTSLPPFPVTPPPTTTKFTHDPKTSRNIMKHFDEGTTASATKHSTSSTASPAPYLVRKSLNTEPTRRISRRRKRHRTKYVCSVCKKERENLRMRSAENVITRMPTLFCLGCISTYAATSEDTSFSDKGAWKYITQMEYDNWGKLPQECRAILPVADPIPAAEVTTAPVGSKVTRPSYAAQL